MVGVERGLIRPKTLWVVRFRTTSHVVEMKRDELLKFYSGRLPVAESMKNSPMHAFLCHPSAAAPGSSAAAALRDVHEDAVVLARAEPVFDVLSELSPQQSASLAQWVRTE